MGLNRLLDRRASFRERKPFQECFDGFTLKPEVAKTGSFLCLVLSR